MHPIETLRIGVESFEPFLQPDGELDDPILGVPTQYGTPCHAYCQAVLASVDGRHELEEHMRRAYLGLDVSLRYITDPGSVPPISEIDATTGTVYALDHRDYYWAPVIKTHRLLKRRGVAMADAFSQRIARIDISTCFQDRPTGGRTAVWLVGEWIRMQENLSPTGPQQFDDWLGDLLEHGLLEDLGFFQEPGHSNATDLLVRYHLAELLCEGYAGRWKDTLTLLFDRGLDRSLAHQLSDGSLASAHICTGQTWTIGILVAYFTRAAGYFNERDPERAQRARDAARLAYRSFLRWQRPDDPYSPVENLLPGTYRIGYEPFTMDGHYSNRALHFLADAILCGFNDGSEHPLPFRPAMRYIDGDPLNRALIHGGPYSVQLHGNPDPLYDGFGVADLTFGPGRFFHFVSAARHCTSGQLFQLGMALREEPGRSPIQPLSQPDTHLIESIGPGQSAASLRMRARVRGALHPYELNAWIDDDGVQIEESTQGHKGLKTLLIPYPRDMGTGYETHTRVVRSPEGAIVRFRHGNEYIRLRLIGAVSHITDLPFGYQNRRGLCGLLRIDLRDPTETLRYRFSIGR